MSLYEIWSVISTEHPAGLATGAIVCILSLIQVSPAKSSPWDSILDWIGQRLTLDLKYEVQALKASVNDMWVSEHRHRILTFARECRRDVDHSKEEWDFVLNIMEEYEQYCNAEKIKNGVVREDTKYIRGVYQELSTKHKII